MNRVKVASMARKIVRVPFANINDEFLVVSAGDFHVGADAFNEAAFVEFLHQVVEKSKVHHVYVILMGDLFDSILFGDRRYSVASSSGTMDDSLLSLKEHLKPLLSNPSIHFVGSLTGNHELAYCRGDINPIYRLYESTGIEPLGSKCYIYFDIAIGGRKLATLRTVAFHGCANSRTPYGRMRIIREFLAENDMTEDEFIRMNQVVFYGHTHETRVETVDRNIPNPRLGEWRTVRQYACLTGSFMDTANFKTNSYAAERGMSPMPVGYIETRVNLKEVVPVAVTDHGLNPGVSTIPWSQM